MGDLLPSWEHPLSRSSTSTDNDNDPVSRFDSGSSSQVDQSLKGKKRSSIGSLGSSSKGRLKDPPLIGSIYTPKKNPPASFSLRSKTEGEIPRHPRSGSQKDSFVFEAIPKPGKDGDRDSTTCEETRSVSDNSSSMQFDSAASGDQNLPMAASSKRAPMPDNSAVSSVLKDPPIPMSVRSTRSKDPSIPRSVESSSSRLKEPPIPRSLEPRYDDRSREGSPYRDSRSPPRPSRRRYEEGQPPPLAPYGDEYSDMPPPPRSNRYEDDYYGRQPRHEDVHDSRARPYDDRYDDDNMSRMSRYQRDDRPPRHGGYARDRDHPRYHRHHSPPRHHPHDPYEDDDNRSRVSRSGRYEDQPPVPHTQARPGRLADGGSNHSGRSRSSYLHHREEGSVSQPSRYATDRPVGYHHNRGRDRYHYSDERPGPGPGPARYQQPPRHHHPREYDDDCSRDDGRAYDRYDTYPPREAHPPRDGHYARRRYDRGEPYHHHASHEDYTRSDDLYAGRSSHSRESYHRRGGGGAGGGYPGEGYRRSPERAPLRDDMYEAKMRAFGGAPARAPVRDALYEEKMRAFGGAPAHARAPDHDALYEEKMQAYGGTRGATSQQVNSRDGAVFVDIGCGEKAKLRRTQETMDAIATDFYSPATCLVCACDLFCISDVKYIVCPQCKTISPAEAASSGGTAISYDAAPFHRHGVGLGFTCETLFRMQSEVMQKRGEARLKTGY